MRNFWGKQATGAPPPVSFEDGFHQNGWTNIYRTPENSILFRSVLSDSSPRDEQPVARKQPAASGPKVTAKHKAKIGEDLRTKADAVRGRGEALALLTDARVAGYISGALADLDRQFCRVAFIGQMNSGKSSLINVLTQRPDFLPTDINPWTTVVTNLHFGAPSAQTKGVVFKFFDWDEWGRLAEGSPRIKELTRLLMPDFDWESFAEQVDALRGRAREQLGVRFEELAGKSHQFSDVTRDLLERYICAGSPFNYDADGSRAGEYSSITKVADIYFDLECFNFPTTLVDTPGVNDPFLVRDEITRQNLELADIYVVVLTARQPLSQADLNLLRLLRGLNKERIVIFVNKIDEVDGIADHAAEVIARIRTLLAKELDYANVPIILGSASWAKAALSGGEHEIEGALAASQSFAGSGGIFNPAESFWLDNSSQREVNANELLTRSGVPNLAAALSDLMLSGSIPSAMKGIEALLTTIAKNAEAVAARNVALTSELIEALHSGGETKQKVTRRLRDKAATIRHLEAEGEARIVRLEAEIDGLVKDLSAELRGNLDKHVAAFGEAQSRDFLERDKQRNKGAWRCNTLPLRCELEAELSNALKAAQTRIGALQEGAAKDLQDMMGCAASDLEASTACGPLPFRQLSPSLAPLGEMVAVDSDNPAWAQWWSQPMAADERARRLRTAIETEFGGISERLVGTVEEEIKRLATAVLGHFRIVMFAPMEDWRRKLEAHAGAAEDADTQRLLESDLAYERMLLENCGALLAEFQTFASARDDRR